MAQPNHTPRLVESEEALTVLSCLIDDAHAQLKSVPTATNPSSTSRTPTSSPSSSSCEAWKANALSCITWGR
jgi:hypothetical protein